MPETPEMYRNSTNLWTTNLWKNNPQIFGEILWFYTIPKIGVKFGMRPDCKELIEERGKEIHIADAVFEYWMKTRFQA